MHFMNWLLRSNLAAFNFPNLHIDQTGGGNKNIMKKLKIVLGGTQTEH